MAAKKNDINLAALHNHVLSGLTQQEIATKLGVSQSWVSKALVKHPLRTAMHERKHCLDEAILLCALTHFKEDNAYRHSSESVASHVSSQLGVSVTSLELLEVLSDAGWTHHKRLVVSAERFQFTVPGVSVLLGLLPSPIQVHQDYVVDSVVAAYKSNYGVSMEELSAAFGIPKETISQIVRTADPEGEYGIDNPIGIPV